MNENKINTAIGYRLKNLRKSLNIKKKEFAANMNISIQQLDKYEKGINRIPIAKLVIITEKYKIDLIHFFNYILENNNEINKINLCFIKIKDREIRENLAKLIVNIANSPY